LKAIRRVLRTSKLQNSCSAANIRRFSDVDEIYILQVSHGKLVGAFGVEDNLARLHQLGLTD
jgi:hypothetical protein